LYTYIEMNGFSRGAAGIFVSWLLAGGCSRAFGQQYPFLPVPGSPGGVTNLFQDSRGRLWLGGDQLACFDGTHVFFLREYGFPRAETFGIAEDPSGAIWIAAETGVYRFADGRIEEIVKGSATSVIAVSPDFAVANMILPAQKAGSAASLARIRRDGSRWNAEAVMPLGYNAKLRRDPSGSILFSVPELGWGETRPEDLARWRSGQAVPVVQHQRPNRGRAVVVTRDRSGCLWFGTTIADGYDCGDGIHHAPYSWALVGPNLHEASDGRMILLGDNLLALGKPGSFQIATRANGMPGGVDPLVATDGTVWLEAPGGLIRFASPFRIEYWTAREGLPDMPWTIVRNRGRIYAGLDRRIVALSPDRLRWETIATFPQGGTVDSLLGLPDGDLLACFAQGGAAQVATDGRIIARTETGRPPGGCTRLTRAGAGEIWSATDQLGRITRQGSLLKWEPRRLQAPALGHVQDVKYQEDTRKLWACYEGGLVVRDRSGSWKEYTTRDGLLTNRCWSLAPLPNGDVWDAYFGGHAFALIRPGPDGRLSVRQYGQSDGVPGPDNTNIGADSRGWLWRGGTDGAYVADQTEAEAGQWLQLDELDGFPASGINSGSLFVDDDSSLWWGTGINIIHYIPPADLVTPKFAPQVFVSAFSWEGQAPRLAEAVAALPHGSKVTAHIGSLQFDRRNALRVRYRLLPEQPAWHETRTLDLALGKLSSGAHTLEVQGRIFTGPWSGTERRSFTVLRPVGLTWPLLAAYFMAATALATGGYLLHRRHLAEEAALLPDLAAWRMGALLPEVHELEGTLLDARFEVGGLLARGGFANVFDGHDREQKQRCAIKVFRGEVKDKAWIQRSFEQEVAALKKVRHPNVVSIYAHGAAHSGAPYLVMEFVEGRNLREVLEAGPLPPQRTARLLRQLASALDAIHAQEICHRDVKPENIILRHEGSAQEESVLIDFSIAIVKDANETLHGLSRAAGSFDYMAPEQAVGYAEPSSDIYSLAKLVLEMLTGRQLKNLLPDAALNLPERVRVLARGLGVGFSDESIEMLATALEFDPARRPRAAGSFAEPLVNDLLAAFA
jgi:tRNA A-37 threonylcarbamoyl transferase component Bud32